MTKRKKESQKENRVATKVSGGKITKAKHTDTSMETRSTKKMQVRLVRTPLVQRQSTSLPQELIAATHSIGKLAPKWTSTPLNTATAKNPEDKTFRLRRLPRKNLKYNTLVVPDRPPLSPIGNLINPSSNVGRDNISIQSDNKSKENASPLPTKTRMNLRLSMRAQESARTRSESKNCPKSNTRSTALKVSECDSISNNPGRICRRRSIGIPKASKITKANDSMEVPTTYKNNRCSELRVRLKSCSTSADKALDTVIPKTNNRGKSAPRHSKEVSFVQRLRDDWSTTSLNDTLSQVQQIGDEFIIPLRADKRKLSPLIELSSYESSISTLKPPITTSAHEDDYSSSAEFESSDENENKCSKRAPTWKDLSNKSVMSVSHTPNQISQKHLQNSRSMKVRVRKLRIHAVPGGSVLTNKDTEVIRENRNDKVPSKNLEETIVTSMEVPSQEKNKQQADMNNPSQEPAATDFAMSPSPKSRNLLNKSDLIEQILFSSPGDDVQHILPTDETTSNCTRKFFHSLRDKTAAVVPQTVQPLNSRRTSRRNKKRDKIYDFLSQSSSDSNDPVADIIQKMINNGKVVVAKHKKGTGKSVVPRRKRKVATKNKHPNVDDVFVKPNPPSSPVKPQPPPVEAEPINNGLAFEFDVGSAPYVDEEPVRDQRGFSKLARSAMIKHAGKSGNSSQRKRITDKQQLLAMAQKFVGQSTPVRVSSPSMSNVTTPFSPIPGGSSPWRVDDDKLPTTFYFDRNSDNLPSYSSDYIPSTPSKNKSKSTSSSSNDSNGENVAPPSVPLAENHAQISLNTRRELSYRSPLKAINILEVINLPPLAVVRRDKEAPKENTNSNILNSSAANKSNSNLSNLFGFEEMIEDDEGDVDITHQILNAGKINLEDQLQRLKRLRYELPKATTSTNNCIKPVFDNERQTQKTLQQMFCSTMIERQSIEPQNSTVETNHFNGTGDGNLFKDPDPETTFDQSRARRSYSRPFKRKRKLRHNFVMFMDSDASEEEEDDDVAAKNQQKKLKERNKKAPKENLELKKFVDDFNAMCKEVSEYELIVE